MRNIHDTFNAFPPPDFESLWWELDPAYEAGRLYVIGYEIEGEDGGTWHVEIVSDPDSPPPKNCKVLEGPAESPDLRLTLGTDDWLTIVSGQASPYALLASGRLRAVGNQGLLSDLNFLGLLGRPPEEVELEPYKSKRWVETPSWVLPRVVFAGRIDYDKWRYFAEEKHEVKARFAWKPLSWRIPLVLVLCILLATAVNWLEWPIYLAIATGALLVIGVPRLLRYLATVLTLPANMITKLACKDEAFFQFAIDHSLIQIIPYWHDRTASRF